MNSLYSRTFQGVGVALFSLLAAPLTHAQQSQYGNQNEAKGLSEGNPIIPGLFADPSLAKFGDTYYLYCTTDGFGWPTGRWVVWTSKDFAHWSFSGQSFPEITGQKNWAPGKPILRDKRYWFPFTLRDNNYLAVGDKPEGPFRFANGGQMLSPSIDAELFVDDDGKPYLISGNVKPVIHRMKPDLSGVDGPPVATLDYGKGYVEGSFLFKRDGIYYAGAANLGYAEYRIIYAMSRNIEGPYTYPKDNIILEPIPKENLWGTGHGHVLKVDDKDHWVAIYLRSRMGERVDPFQGSGNVYRQICAERFSFNADGTIKPFQPTRTGVGLLARSTERGTNVARGKKATASSSLALYKAAKAVDGGFGTRWIVGEGPQIVPTAAKEKTTWSWTTDKPVDNWTAPNFDASDWAQGEGGFGTTDTPGATVGTPWATGDIWLRRKFSLTNVQLKQDLKLRVYHDDDAEIYVNGVRAATLPEYNGNYDTIPLNVEGRAALRAGTNVLAVHCRQTGGAQFIDAGMVGSETTWWKVDLGKKQRIGRTEISFNYPTEITPYVLEWSNDDKTWQMYADHRADGRYESPKVDRKPVVARYFRVTFPSSSTNSIPAGLWEFKAFNKS